MAKDIQPRVDENIAATSLPSTAQSYFREPTAPSILYGHIGLMLLAWIGCFPIFVTLDLAGSRFAYPSQVLFLGLNAIGIVFGLAYNSKTPNLYPGSVHHKIGWALTGIAVSQFLARILRSYLSYRHTRGMAVTAYHEEEPLVSPSASWNGSDEHLYEDRSDRATSNPPRAPYRSGEGTGANGSSLRNMSRILLRPWRPAPGGRHRKNGTWIKREFKFVGSLPLDSIMAKTSVTFSTVLVILMFVAICTGLVTMAGIFHGKHIFNGLAHFIKGGVFFGFGVITLWRWMGGFSGIGRARNNKHAAGPHHHGPGRFITMEWLESSLIFIYGIMNVFLEHLSEWGGRWVAQDFEHVAISVLFIGGGLCGIMIEHQGYGRLARTSPITQGASTAINEKRTLMPGYSINPINPLIIFLLGRILGGHQQASVQSTMMHQWVSTPAFPSVPPWLTYGKVGNLLTGASAARCLTYLMLYLAPPTSTSPSRTPSECVTSFCLMAAGIMLMASNRDTIDAMIEYDVNAMVVATMAMSVTAASMAWCMALVAVKRWAENKQALHRERIISVE
ncbi:integral membrane protein [Cladophialophora carrionii]|uniref:Integral membrane protein n=1 Tax=Cladophialophora carrionii TaxID=86049 RepID=A0A1C1C7P2_9EURO|nr:integral membrane protein [Cladophialophora carrionii]